MTDPRLVLTLDGPVATLTLSRPEKLNALDSAMVDAIQPICRQVERSGVRVLILTGEGERSFCAGGDIAAWGGWSAEDFARHWVRDGHTAFDALELAACADIRIAENHVRIGQPESGIGIIPGWSGTQRAVRRFGAQVVRRMALMGEVFDADQALGLGLVDQVVEKGGGMAAARLVAERVIARSPRATEITKMLVNAAEGEERERVFEALAGAAAVGTPDLAEGLAAFAARRKPDFGGKT